MGGLALLAIDSKKAKAAVAHLVVVLTLLGGVGGLGMGAAGALRGKSQVAVAEQLLMGVLACGHVYASVQHFKANKKARLAAEKDQKTQD